MIPDKFFKNPVRIKQNALIFPKAINDKMKLEKKFTSRRTFIKVLATSGLIMSGPVWGKDELQNNEKVILFQGNSITDAGRDKQNQQANHSRALGHGYAFLAASQLLEEHPDQNLKIYNRGISGNKVFQLKDRWQQDCLELKPEVLSILIGVNDFWHTLSYNYDGTVAVYEQDFRNLLSQTRSQLPRIKLIIGEPFVLKGGTAITEAWFPAFEQYQQVAAQIARDFDAVFIPYQQIFDQALKKAPVSYWAPDGVHPSMAGAELMAEAWLKAYGKIKSL